MTPLKLINYTLHYTIMCQQKQTHTIHFWVTLTLICIIFCTELDDCIILVQKKKKQK